jgi:hypothetical protein
MNSGPNTYGVYISSYRESSGFFMDFASTFGQISMTIELELPAWSLRRLIREDDEWFCSLSRQPNLPTTLDTADAHHDSLPLAILLAFLQARRTAETAPAAISVTPHVQPGPHSILCCDNFA